MRAREAFKRAAFRGARIERQTSHHRKLRRADRSTTMPMYGDDIPIEILRRVERDLGIDLSRPVRARRGPRTIDVVER